MPRPTVFSVDAANKRLPYIQTIVRDIVALYDGEMRLGESMLGGLSVEIELPGKGR